MYKIHSLQDELQTFASSIHLYATNEFVTLHNKTMLKKLNITIACYYAEQRKQLPSANQEDEKLTSKVLLCIGQQVILPRNLWVEAGLLKGSLGKVAAIFYGAGSWPLELPSFVFLFISFTTKVHLGMFQIQNMSQSPL